MAPETANSYKKVSGKMENREIKRHNRNFYTLQVGMQNGASTLENNLAVS